MNGNVETSEGVVGGIEPAEIAADESPTPPHRAWLLFVFLFAVYSLNPDYICLNDLTPNVWQPLQVLDGGGLTFSANTHPFMFNLPRSNAEGTSKAAECKYYLVESAVPGRYVNIYGIGATLTALPVYAVMKCLVSDLAKHSQLVWFTARETAAALTALSAMFLYLAALALTGRRNALVTALAYGLGTCVWSTCSQGLWQQTPAVFYLALGTCLFVRIERVRWLAAPCAMAWAAAVWCRPTSVIVVLCAGVWLLFRDRRAFAAYALSGLPFAVALAFHNYHCLGSPFAFGQSLASRNIAVELTGSPSLWKTPLAEGLAGLLASPARGLFVYSPFFLLAIPGMVRVWTSPKHAVLRPLAAAALLILCVEAKFFCWWGGWSYGYRLVLDITVFLSLMLIPVMDALRRGLFLRGLFAGALIWSIAVQIIGVTVYDLTGWNDRKAVLVFKKGKPDPVLVMEESEVRVLRGDPAFADGIAVSLDVDYLDYRGRLWAVKDSPLVYYVTHVGAARAERSRQSQHYAADKLSEMLDGIAKWVHGNAA